MKFTLSVNDFKQGLAEVSKGLGNTKTNEVFGGILIEGFANGIKLTATDGTVRIEKTVNCEIENAEKVLANAEMFLGIINQLNTNEFCEISTKDNTLHIKAKGVNVKQKCFDAQFYPTSEFLSDTANSITINTTDLVGAIQNATTCVSTEDSRPILKGINLSYKNSKLVVASCDGYKLSKTDIDIKNAINENNFSVTIPNKTLTIIQNIFANSGEITLTFDDRKLQVMAENIILVSSLIEGQYLGYDRLIPNDFKFTAVLETAELKQALALSMVVSKGEKSNLFKFNIPTTYNNDTIEIVSNAETADSNATIKAEYDNQSIENFTININTTYMLNILKAIKDDKIIVKFNDSNKPIIITGENDNYLFLVLPCRGM